MKRGKKSSQKRESEKSNNFCEWKISHLTPILLRSMKENLVYKKVYKVIDKNQYFCVMWCLWLSEKNFEKINLWGNHQSPSAVKSFPKTVKAWPPLSRHLSTLLRILVSWGWFHVGATLCASELTEPLGALVKPSLKFPTPSLYEFPVYLQSAVKFPFLSPASCCTTTGTTIPPQLH